MLKRQKVKKIKKRHRVRNTLLTLLGLVLLLGGAVVWMGHNALQARDQLQAAVQMIPALERQVREDPDNAGPQLAALQAATSEARTRTTGPLWTIASFLPVAGPNIDALGTITQTVDSLSHDVLPDLSAAVQSVQPSALAPQNGRINLDPILSVRNNVLSADGAVERAIASLERIDRTPLVPQLSEAADDLEGRLRDVSATTATAAKAVQLIPPMLGADGPRDWVVLAQNNAETRSTGGIVGALIGIRTNNGLLTFEEKASTASFGSFAEPVLPLTSEEDVLWGEILGRFIQNVSMTPDFPRTAQLAAQMWQNNFGTRPTGVISIDPVALQSFLRVTGPVTFYDPEGEPITLNGDNAANFLMSEIYARFPNPRVQDEVFADAAEVIFNRLVQGDVNAAGIIDAIVQAADDGRLMIWSAIPAEQEILAPTVLSGELRGSQPDGDGKVSPVPQVALNVFGSNKIGYYLDASAEITDVTLRPDGSQQFTLTVRLTNLLEEGQAQYLPNYVIGDGSRTGFFGVQVLTYAPDFGQIIGSGSSDITTRMDTFTHNGFSVRAFDVKLEPGETEEVRAIMISGPGQSGPTQLRMPPGPRP